MKIPQNIIEELIEQAEKDAPDESCGYLLGIGDEVTENYWMENIDHSSEHFSFAPKDQFAALRYVRDKGLKILANWHSHPASPSPVIFLFILQHFVFLVNLSHEIEGSYGNMHISCGISSRRHLSHRPVAREKGPRRTFHWKDLRAQRTSFHRERHT